MKITVKLKILSLFEYMLSRFSEKTHQRTSIFSDSARGLLLIFATSTSLLFPSCCHAEEAEESLFVKLETESKLSPLYLLPLTAEQSTFSQDYVQQLEKILAFDIDHNAATFIVKRNAEADKLGQESPPSQVGPLSSWKEQRVLYVVKPAIQDQSLKATLLDLPAQRIKSTVSLPLTGELKEDRRQVHRLADTIHQALFGSEGIASSRLLFTIKTGISTDSSKWISEVWESDYDGANLEQLTHDQTTCVSPIYLPPKPGAKPGAFLYVSYEMGQPKIYISSFNTGKKQRLIWMRGNQLMPAISRQRDQIAFICDITGNPDLFLQPFSPEKGPLGKAQQIFAAKLATQGSPTFSPDGKQIAFVSNKEGSPKIYVMPIPAPGTNVNQLKAVKITKANRENSAPSWSPDGKKIAYCARSGGERQIWVYDVEKDQEIQITQGDGNKENPSWAPNSLHLVYNSANPGECNLFITNLNQKTPRQITSGPGEKLFPNWEPR